MGAAGSTGRGEANLHDLSSFLIVEGMRRGLSPKDAGMEALKRIRANTVEAGLLNSKGNPNYQSQTFRVRMTRCHFDRAAALPDHLRLEPQAAFAAVTGTTRYLVTLQQSPFVCELFVCGDDAHDTARFARRERVRVLNRGAFMATAEDMIVTKLRWATRAKRVKDRDDVRNIIAVRGAELDWN